jgi:hypothetical protein
MVRSVLATVRYSGSPRAAVMEEALTALAGRHLPELRARAPRAARILRAALAHERAAIAARDGRRLAAALGIAGSLLRHPRRPKGFWRDMLRAVRPAAGAKS